MMRFPAKWSTLASSGVIYYDINQIITMTVMTLSKHFDTTWADQGSPI